MRVPDWWQALLLALAVFRLARLVGWDTITANLRGWATLTDYTYRRWHEFITAMLAQGRDPWDATDKDVGVCGEPPFPLWRWKAAELARCPWCAGFWLSGLAWAAWSLEPRATLWVATWLALSAAVGLVAKHLDADEKEPA